LTYLRLPLSSDWRNIQNDPDMFRLCGRTHGANNTKNIWIVLLLMNDKKIDLDKMKLSRHMAQGKTLLLPVTKKYFSLQSDPK